MGDISAFLNCEWRRDIRGMLSDELERRLMLPRAHQLTHLTEQTV